MSILLYAISRDDARAPAASELREICAAGLRALAEPVQEPLEADLEALVQYEETVETVMQRHTILPMRFGSVVDGEDEVRALLKAHAREYAAALAHLDGAVEFGVQASLTSSASGTTAPTAGPGSSYMQARLREQECRRELQSWLDAAFDGLVRERRYRASPVCGPAAISGAYLVEQEAEDQFLLRIEELADTAGHHLSWSGPWPPYTFVEGIEQ